MTRVRDFSCYRSCRIIHMSKLLDYYECLVKDVVALIIPLQDLTTLSYAPEHGSEESVVLSIC